MRLLLLLLLIRVVPPTRAAESLVVTVSDSPALPVGAEVRAYSWEDTVYPLGDACRLWDLRWAAGQCTVLLEVQVDGDIRWVTAPGGGWEAAPRLDAPAASFAASAARTAWARVAAADAADPAGALYAQALEAAHALHAEAEAWVAQFWAVRLPAREALPLWELAEHLRDAAHPLLLAETRMLRGKALWRTGDRAGAAACWQAAADLTTPAYTDTAVHGVVLGMQGLAAQKRGALAESEALCRAADRVLAAVAPDGQDRATLLLNLAETLRLRGRVAEAERHTRTAAAVYTRLGNQFGEAYAYAQMGFLNHSRLNEEAAERDYCRAAELYLALGHRRRMPAMHNALGTVAEARGALDTAAGFYRDALLEARSLGLPPGETVRTLVNLAEVAHKQGDPDAAERYLAEATQAVEAEDLDPPASLLRLAGALALEADDPQQALEALLKARAQLRAEAPDSHEAATVGRLLTRAYRAAHQEDAAADAAREALAVLERQSDEVGGEVALMRFRTHFAPVYKEALDLFYTADRTEDALAVSEAYRDHVSRRMAADRAHARPDAPRLAAPGTDLGAVEAALTPDGVALVYTVDDTHTWLTVVDGTGQAPQTVRLALGRRALMLHVRALREALMRPGDTADIDRRAALLFDLLVRPVMARLTRAKRVFLLPDGPLHGLPFAVLATGRDGDPADRFGVWKALVRVQSFSALLGAPAPLGGGDVLVYADPDYGGTAHLPLPGTRREAAAVAGRFPGRTRRVMGRPARADRLVEDAAGASVLHVAAHAVLQVDDPLASALILSAAPDGNGRLTVWDLLSGPPLPLDLVVLSACDTALGEDLAGEGLLSLTRAFRLVGARSVVAGLWPQEDRQTVHLMAAFYTRLAAGEAPAEALQGARRARALAGAHPYHWAGWVLQGAP